MIPILYERDETAFTSNGIARLRDCISCTVTEERNGVYECDFDYPVDGAHFGEIIPGRIIAVIHDDSGDVQPFDIVSYTKPIDGIVSFHAVHISYRQSFLAVTGSEINSLADAFNLLTTASPDNPFTYWTDFTSAAYFAGADGTPKTVRQLLGGSEGSILDTYGGEYEWDKFTVKLWKNRGKTCDFTIRYGINMTDYNEELDEFGSFNSCIPYWNGEGGPVIGSKVSSGLESYNGRELCVPLDLTDKFEAAPSVAGLEAAALAYMTTKQTSLPSQNIKVDFLRLQDFSGYEEFSDLLECSLCDTISVLFPQYGMSGSYKIVRTVFDVLENRFTEMELGALRTSLAEAMGISGGSYSSSGTAGANGKSAYQYAVEAGYTGTEDEFAQVLANAADNEDVVHIEGTETVKGEKTFTKPLTIQTASDTNSLRVISTNSGGYFQVIRRQNSGDCTMEIRSGINGGTFGTLTNHPYKLRVHNTDSVIMGTDMSVKLAHKPAASDDSTQVATTEWTRDYAAPMTGEEITNICQ